MNATHANAIAQADDALHAAGLPTYTEALRLLWTYTSGMTRVQPVPPGMTAHQAHLMRELLRYAEPRMEDMVLRSPDSPETTRVVYAVTSARAVLRGVL